MARITRDIARKSLLMALTALFLAGAAVGASPAYADHHTDAAVEVDEPGAMDDYNPKRAGHPLRILAYALHPVGVMADYLILRPAYFIGHWQPFRTLFGRTDD